MLDVQAVFEEVGQEPGLSHRLIVAAHDAEGHDRATVFHHHAWDDRMHRPLAAGNAIRMSAFQPEAEAAVLQHDAGFVRQDAAAEVLEQRVDEAAGVAILVDDAEIDGILVRGQDQLAGGWKLLHRRGIGDQGALGREVFRAEQFLDRNIDRAWICQESITIAIGQTRGLDMPMGADRAAGCHPGRMACRRACPVSSAREDPGRWAGTGKRHGPSSSA